MDLVIVSEKIRLDISADDILKLIWLYNAWPSFIFNMGWGGGIGVNPYIDSLPRGNQAGTQR